MAIFKCKMCGGQLEIEEERSVCTCEYCGTEQTLPKVMDENLQSLFNRANVLRMKAEFDKASEIYEKILQANGTEAEAYWGLILCKYGIEYVEDPITYKRVPTCHRASFDAVVVDDDYKMALQYSDMMQRRIYEDEAQKIDEIQKGIVSLAQKEEPYDVFICYKETDENGNRTQDSVIANDIYYQLTQEGYKVFYAAITLEDKIGQEYEPYIFSALNSARVMLAIGSKPEYFTAVWVKNEWSRFLNIMKKDRARILIPCYKEIDAYELPEEFAHLQAQDMSKIGFVNDLIRGIKKVVIKEESNDVQVTTSQKIGTNSSFEIMLKRAFMALEDEDYAKADEFAEELLNMNPESAAAYLIKLLAELKVNKKENLIYSKLKFDDSKHYQKICRFGDVELIAELKRYSERRTELLLQNQYDMAIKEANNRNYENAIRLFSEIESYRDSAEQLLKNQYDMAIKVANDKNYEKAIMLFLEIENYKDSAEQIKICEKNRILKEKAETRNEKRVKLKEIENEIENLKQNIDDLNKKNELYKKHSKQNFIVTTIVCLFICFLICCTGEPEIIVYFWLFMIPMTFILLIASDPIRKIKDGDPKMLHEIKKMYDEIDNKQREKNNLKKALEDINQ